MPKDKTLRVSAKAEPRVEGGDLVIAGPDGLIAVTIVDTQGSVMYVYHPMSGWYVEIDTREDRDSQ